MVFGGTFDPAYVLEIFALPTQLQPTTNKRNAALVQKHMEEGIGVKPSRGFLRFIPTLEENTARNGKTLAGEIEEVGKSSATMSAGAAADEFTGIRRTRSKPKQRLSVRVSILDFTLHKHTTNQSRRSAPSGPLPWVWRRQTNPLLPRVQARQDNQNSRDEGQPRPLE